MRSEVIMDSIKQRAIKATAVFLERKGYGVVSTGWSCPEGEIGVVARDGECVVFLEVTASEDGFAKPEVSRTLRETLAAKWLAAEGGEIADVPVRFDDVAFIVVGGTRALVRHHINSLSEE